MQCEFVGESMSRRWGDDVKIIRYEADACMYTFNPMLCRSEVNKLHYWVFRLSDSVVSVVVAGSSAALASAAAAA